MALLEAAEAQQERAGPAMSRSRVQLLISFRKSGGKHRKIIGTHRNNMVFLCFLSIVWLTIE